MYGIMAEKISTISCELGQGFKSMYIYPCFCGMGECLYCKSCVFLMVDVKLTAGVSLPLHICSFKACC